MLIGPNGEKRPVDAVANTARVMEVATGETDETYVGAAKQKGGQKGGVARAATLSQERLREIAQQAAAAR